MSLRSGLSQVGGCLSGCRSDGAGSVLATEIEDEIKAKYYLEIKHSA